MRFRTVIFLTALLLVSCGKSNDAPQYPESTAGLTQLTNDLFQSIKSNDKERTATLIASMKLPDPGAWFKGVFGDALGTKLATEYTEQLSTFDAALTGLFTKMVEENQTVLKISQFAKAGDAEATGLQNTALEKMTTPATLYSLRMLKAGEEHGMHLWSFVYVDGAFRLAGKMQSVSE
jgi:hypothetical protein